MDRLIIYSDLHCPYAYLALARLRHVTRETQTPIDIEHRALAIEWLDQKPTPKPILDAESPLILAEEPQPPYQPWRAPEWTWPVTMLPAFEAVQAAATQNPRAAHELDWRLRERFFAHHQCISLRHTILAAAHDAGLDTNRLAHDLDHGTARHTVMTQTREGWERCDVSPTFLLPNGQLIPNPAGPHVDLDDEHRVQRHTPSPQDWRQTYHDILRACR